MDHIRTLRRLFRHQLRLRGILAAGVTVSLIFGFALVTASFDAWWFSALPWLKTTSTWIKAQDSWDLFVYVFLAITAIGYLQQVQSVILDRHNGRVLVKLSEDEIAAESFGPAAVGKPAALLGARRRTLESLFRADPGVYSLLTVVVALLILGHPISGALLVVFAAFLLWYFPRMVRSFTALKDSGENDGEESKPDSSAEPAKAPPPAKGSSLPHAVEADRTAVESLTPAERRAHRKAMQELRAQRRLEEQNGLQLERARQRATERLAFGAERMFTVINRPLVRLRIGWPILVAGASAVASVAAITINEMSNAGELPQRGTLLVVLLVLTGRSCMSLAQYWEDLAFFTASLALIDASESGQERL